MWFIKIKENKEETLIKRIFKTKQDAFNFIKNNNYCFSDSTFINGETNLVSDDIKIDAFLQVNVDDKVIDYGFIHEITDYLVLIKKKNGNTAEFTKSRINKEYVTGVFNIY